MSLEKPKLLVGKFFAGTQCSRDPIYLHFRSKCGKKEVRVQMTQRIPLVSLAPLFMCPVAFSTDGAELFLGDKLIGTRPGPGRITLDKNWRAVVAEYRTKFPKTTLLKLNSLPKESDTQ